MFWLDRYLTSIGVENFVMDSASIEVNRRKRRVSTDRVDVEELTTPLVLFSAITRGNAAAEA